MLQIKLLWWTTFFPKKIWYWKCFSKQRSFRTVCNIQSHQRQVFYTKKSVYFFWCTHFLWCGISHYDKFATLVISNTSTTTTSASMAISSKECTVFGVLLFRTISLFLWQPPVKSVSCSRVTSLYDIPASLTVRSKVCTLVWEVLLIGGVWKKVLPIGSCRLLHKKMLSLNVVT